MTMTLSYPSTFQNWRSPSARNVPDSLSPSRKPGPPVYGTGVVAAQELLAAYVEVTDVRVLRALHDEYSATCADLPGPLVTETWGAVGFTVCDPGGNRLYFSATEQPASRQAWNQQANRPPPAGPSSTPPT